MLDGHLSVGTAPFAAVILAGGRGSRLGGRDKPMVAVGGVPMLSRVIAAATEAGARTVVVVGPARDGLGDGVLTVLEEPAGGGPVAAAAAGLAALDAVDPGPAAAAAGLAAADVGPSALNPEPSEVDVGPSALDAADVGPSVLDAADVGPSVLDVADPGPSAGGVVALLAADLPLLSGDALRVLIGRLGAYDGALFVDGDGRRQLLCGVWRRAALLEAVASFGVLQGGSLRALVRGLRVVEVRWVGGGAPYFDCDTEEDLRKAEL